MSRVAAVAVLVSSLLVTTSASLAECAQDVLRRVKAVTIVREAPRATAAQIGTIPKDSTVTVQVCADGWCHLRFRALAGFVPDTMFVSDSARAPTPASTTPARRNCCRVCSTGKPCGNGCIARTATCRQPPGCAC